MPGVSQDNIAVATDKTPLEKIPVGAVVTKVRQAEFIEAATKLRDAAVKYRFTNVPGQNRVVFSFITKPDLVRALGQKLRDATQVFKQGTCDVDYIVEVGAWYVSITDDALPQTSIAAEHFIAKVAKM